MPPGAVDRAAESELDGSRGRTSNVRGADDHGFDTTTGSTSPAMRLKVDPDQCLAVRQGKAAQRALQFVRVPSISGMAMTRIERPKG
jgi:hypothetical protein